MSAEWFCRIRGEESGPFEARDLRTMVRSGQLLPENLVRRGRSGPWVVARRVQGLFSDAPASQGGAVQKARSETSSAGSPEGRLQPSSSPPPTRKPAEIPSLGALSEESPDQLMNAPIPVGQVIGNLGATQHATAEALVSLRLGQTSPPGGADPLHAIATPSRGTRGMGSLHRSRVSSQRIMGLSIAGILVGFVALCVYWFPIVSLVLASLAATFSIRAIGMCQQNKSGGIAIAAVSALVSLAACLGGVYGTFFGPGSEEKGPIERARARLLWMIGEDPSLAGRIGTDWYDAASEAAIDGNLKISLTDVGVGNLPGELPRPGRSPKNYLFVNVRLENQDATRKIDYSSWSGAGSLDARLMPTLVDKHGNSYRRVVLQGSTAGEQLRQESIYPGKAILELLVFEQPISKFGHLELTLPSSAYGGNGAVAFRIPFEMVQNFSTSSFASRSSDQPAKPKQSRQRVVEIKKESVDGAKTAKEGTTPHAKSKATADGKAKDIGKEAATAQTKEKETPKPKEEKEPKSVEEEIGFEPEF